MDVLDNISQKVFGHQTYIFSNSRTDKVNPVPPTPSLHPHHPIPHPITPSPHPTTSPHPHPTPTPTAIVGRGYNYWIIS